MIWNILGLLGISGIFGALWKYLAAKLKETRRQSEVHYKALVCLLRSELIKIYSKYKGKESCSLIDKENFESLYQMYKELGGNGVIEHIRDEILNLPTEE